MRDVELDGVRRKGGGRRAVQKKTPEVITKIEELMKHDTAGDPMTGVKWTRRTTDKIACELRSLGVNVSSKTVGRLLKQLGFSLRVNHKKLCGATSERCRGWKHGLQTRICNRHDIAITIAHYPSGTSKWNPVEHRLFSEISKNWAGRPLDSYETILKYIRTTTTSSGLRVRAHLIRRRYPKGVKITDERMQALSVTKDQTLPKWNYTIRPS